MLMQFALMIWSVKWCIPNAWTLSSGKAPSVVYTTNNEDDHIIAIYGYGYNLRGACHYQLWS